MEFWSSKKLPNTLIWLTLSLNKIYKSFNLYFQEESRCRLINHVGTEPTAKGVKSIVNYQQDFKNTYLYGSHFTWEAEGVDTLIFEAYLKEFSEELKIIIINNAGFHATKNITLPDSIKLIRMPTYTPELNPCKKVW